MTRFKSQNPNYEYLRKKWLQKHESLAKNVTENHSDVIRRVALGGLGGLMLLTTPALSVYPPVRALNNHDQVIQAQEDKNLKLLTSLEGLVPSQVRKLNSTEEENLTKLLSNKFGFKVLAEVDGVRLNTDYGLIGGEQHLYRYPGDNLFKHADNLTEWEMYGSSGIAPHLGAWGYFAPSQSQFGEMEKQREKYYIAIQTFLSPGFAENVDKYRDFFKYRKMLLVNPNTGQAVIADIADSGPSEWTGKQLGGSPEVMQALGLAQGPRKGVVLYFFIDDPSDNIPLGPINIK